ncbi:MAG: zf-HC2 domain-containing protein [Actinobacteria bacterium]|nr:zf-HC2 domain-containing protein [Actinomycetota bacterium]
MTPDLALELASAYLDGEVTATERAEVEGSAELLGRVASLRAARSVLAAIPVVTEDVRENAIVAALAEFGASSVERNGSVVTLADRRRWPKTALSAAAAVLLVGIVGVTVLQSTDEEKSADTAATSEPKLADASTQDESVAAALPPNVGGEAPQPAEFAVQIDDPQQLLLLDTPPTEVADTTAAQRVETLNFSALACMPDGWVFLGDIYYRGVIAIAVRDGATGVTEAIDGNCSVLASATP